MGVTIKSQGKPEPQVKGMTAEKEKSMGVQWLKTGEESAKLAEVEKALQEKKKAEGGKLFRFFMKKGEDAKLIFVDGDLSPKGYLTPPRFYEHFVNMSGDWVNIICPQQTNPTAGEKCPICEAKDKPSLVSLFTVIDLRPFKTKDGKVIPFTKKLFVAKPITFELLNKLAVKRGGLTGCIFDVSRVGEKSPAVGDVFDFTEKLDPAAATAKYTVSYSDKEGKTVTKNLFTPADYGNELVYRTGVELRKMGFGSPGGFEDDTAEAAGTDYSDKL